MQRPPAPAPAAAPEAAPRPPLRRGAAGGPPPGLLWVVEQIPGYVQAEDTTRLLELGYFPSYNVPFFKVRGGARWWRLQVS
jgi:hypothetical protein